jgi:uncharacterized protein (TIGR02145 family)/prepilin-type N-terminal cleavage/methylation domain-containing protein
MKYSKGFTIVELLVVIVVISILAAVTVVSYTGISKKAIDSSLQVDLSNGSNKLKMYLVEYGSYPTMGAPDSNGTICPTAPAVDNQYCLKPTPGNAFSYSSPNSTTFSMTARHTSSATTYIVTNDTAPALKASLAVSDPTNWLTIGNQVWAKANLNVGTRIAGTSSQTNNAILEKYCYNDTELNCTNYGGLYQWDEMMQYVTSEGARGVCPTDSHIPSDNDWKILEMQLGMSQADADAYGWRGSDQATQLKTGGSSGLNIPLAGYRYSDGSFSGMSTYSYLSSSTEVWGSSSWKRLLFSGGGGVNRDTPGKGEAMSVRCVGD